MSLLPDWWSPYDLGQGCDLLVILNGVTEAEYNSGIWLCSEENEHLLTNLEGFQDSISWAVTALFLEPLPGKPKAADTKVWKPKLYETIHSLRPRCILTLGSDVLSAVWPEELGKVQSITKAKAMDLQFAGIPVVASMNPKVHYTYLKTDGFAGDDLTQEYERAFIKVDSILEGTYTPHLCAYFCIDDDTAAMHLISRKMQLGIKQMAFDTEDTQWWPAESQKLHPHRWWEILEARGLPNNYLPNKLGIWDEDTELDYCSVAWTSPDGVRETYSLNPAVMTYEFLYHLFLDTTVITWNGLTEICVLRRFRDFDMCAPKNRIKHYDGMLRTGTKDQSTGALGLKVLCQSNIGAPAWEVELYQEMNEARARRKEECGIGVAAIDDCKVDTRRQYNAGDSYYLLVLVEDYYQKDKDGGLHPECRAFEWLTKALPFFSRMTCTGTLIDLDLLYSEIDKQEATLAELEEQVHNHWAVALARQAIERMPRKKGEEVYWNFRSPIHFTALIAATYGQILPQRELTDEEQSALKADQKKKLVQDIVKESLVIPPWAPMSESGRQPATGVEVIEFYAKGGVHADTYDHDPSVQAASEIWGFLSGYKVASDDLLKCYTLLNYTSARDGRFRADYRIIKSGQFETSGKDKQTGAVSGRTSTTPNDQNRLPLLKPCDIAPPGYTKVVIDMKGAEMRVIGETTGDALFSEWARLGRDSHLEKAAILWSYATKQPSEEFFAFRSREECARLDSPSPEQKPWRQKGKTLNFAALYMQAPSTFAQTVGISEEEAIALAMQDRQMASGIYHAQCRLYDLLQRGEPAITKIFGRVRYANGWEVTDLTAEQFLSFDKRYRKLVPKKNMDLFRSIWNTWGAQADANDYVIVMGILIDQCLRTGIIPENEVMMNKFVHDSLVFDIWTPKLHIWVPYLAQLMEDVRYLPCPWSLPMSVSTSYGPNMGDAEQGGQVPCDWRQMREPVY